jgi:N-ethylmaleimide reductase
VGLRLSPVTPANDAQDDDPQPLFEYVVRQLAPLGLAYLHLIEGQTGGARDIAPFDYAASLRYRQPVDTVPGW